MDFGLSEEQEMLKRSARDFLMEKCPKTFVRAMIDDEKGYSPQLWHEMSEMGWLGLVFPRDYGGEGGSFLDLIILLEEIGRALLPSPFFATVVLGGLTILEAGSEEQKREYLPRVASGEQLLTLAIAEPGARYETDLITARAVRNRESYTISGTKLFVPYAHVADQLICVARTFDEAKKEECRNGFIVNAKGPGLTCNALKTIGQEKQCEVSLKNVVVPVQSRLGQGSWDNIDSALRMSTVALCAGMNGGMEQILEMSVNYAKSRIQFGRPIGSLQAVQHRCADIAISLEVSRGMTYEAAWKISRGLPCNIEVSLAKAWASEAFRQATWLGAQVQGGNACTEEHDMPLYTRRAKVTEPTFGDAEFHREIIAREIAGLQHVTEYPGQEGALR